MPDRARVVLLLMAFALTTAAGVAQTIPPRGPYFRHADPAFEMWLTKGMHADPATAAGSEQTIACFRENVGDGSSLQIRIPPVTDLAQFDLSLQRNLDSSYPKHKTRRVELEAVAGRPTAAYYSTGITIRPKEGEPVGGMLQVAFVACPSTIVCISWKFGPESFETRLETMRWMLATVRIGGANGLDRWLEPRRRWHLGSGLSLRSPHGFAAVDLGAERDAGARLFAARSASGLTLEVRHCPGLAGHMVLRKQCGERKPVEEPWRGPHDGTARVDSCLVLEADGKSAAALTAVTFDQERIYVIEVRGPEAERERLLVIAERVAMTLEQTDLVAARKEADAAITALEAARRRRKADDMKAALEVLIRYPFFDAATTAMAASLRSISDDALAERVVRALADTSSPAIVPDLLRALKRFDPEEQAAVVTALLRTLGSVRDRRAIAVLLKYVERGDSEVATVAIRALGGYGDIDRRRVVTGLARLMEKSKAAGKKGLEQKRHWRALRPAFMAALSVLVGEPVKTPEDARAALKRRR